MENYIFSFNDREPLSCQDNAICQHLWDQSIYEADEILPHYWRRPKESKCTIENLSRVVRGSSHRRFANSRYDIPLDALTSIKLFSGIVNYSDEEKEVLRRMFRDTTRVRRIIENLLMKRHQLRQFERSDLESVCDHYGS